MGFPELVPYSDMLKQQVFTFTDVCFAELGKRFEPEGRHAFYNDIDSFFEVFYCLTSDDGVVGTAALKKLDDETAELKALYLDKRYRGQGFGKRLIDTVIEEAGMRGFKTVVLDSMKRYKDARRLYEKCGFTDCKRYNDNRYADVFMKLDLQHHDRFPGQNI